MWVSCKARSKQRDAKDAFVVKVLLFVFVLKTSCSKKFSAAFVLGWSRDVERFPLLLSFLQQNLGLSRSRPFGPQVSCAASVCVISDSPTAIRRNLRRWWDGALTARQTVHRSLWSTAPEIKRCAFVSGRSRTKTCCRFSRAQWLQVYSTAMTIWRWGVDLYQQYKLLSSSVLHSNNSLQSALSSRHTVL